MELVDSRKSSSSAGAQILQPLQLWLVQPPSAPLLHQVLRHLQHPLVLLGPGEVKKLSTSTITMSSIDCFPVINIIPLKFFPVVELVFRSVSLSSNLKRGFLDVLILSTNWRNLFRRTLFRCFLPDSGSMKPLWVACGRSSMILTVLFQLLSSLTAPGQNRSHRTLPYQLGWKKWAFFPVVPFTR